jgi:DNA modification methylase
MALSIRKCINKILCGDAYDILKRLPDESIDCVVTSPPYWALRDYGVHEQLGLEPTFPEYLSKLCDVFNEVRRVLKDTGTCWVNMGDTYGGSATNVKYRRRSRGKLSLLSTDLHYLPEVGHVRGCYDKCLLQIPARFAVDMINRGWTLRNEIIWYKPNCMPSSAKDRFTVDFEKIFFFVKNRKYYFRQQFEELRDRARLMRRFFNPHTTKKRIYGDERIASINPRTIEASRLRILKNGRNKRSVWRVAVRPYHGKHFATYPPELIETPIKAGCPKGGVVLDPFIGAGTTALVAKKLGRKFIGIDLNPEYVRLSKRRLKLEGSH